ncbi:unnamed protein product [Plutella xylostella]|uniref:(diamondback moth) hypothetical protein n=1 Tax=Plutella xylostella TaxID=51655 RepID=A0A8S4D7M5_PLUXY|nr:unnamed protein product [Plutella xylostella]
MSSTSSPKNKEKQVRGPAPPGSRSEDRTLGAPKQPRSGPRVHSCSPQPVPSSPESEDEKSESSPPSNPSGMLEDATGSAPPGTPAAERPRRRRDTSADTEAPRGPAAERPRHRASGADPEAPGSPASEGDRQADEDGDDSAAEPSRTPPPASTLTKPPRAETRSEYDSPKPSPETAPSGTPNASPNSWATASSDKTPLRLTPLIADHYPKETKKNKTPPKFKPAVVKQPRFTLEPLAAPSMSSADARASCRSQLSSVRSSP